MRTRLTFLMIFVLFGLISFAQSVPKGYWWVKLKDKNGTAYQVAHPGAFLSQRALTRRSRQQIAVDESDLPVSSAYIDSLKKKGLEIVHTSKWLNGVTVRTGDTTLIKKITSLPFVSSVQLSKPILTTKSTKLKFREEELSVNYNPANYGNAVNQLTQLNGQFLHNLGYRGKGIIIAILDGGFWHVNQINAFDSLRNSGRILGIRDFVDPAADFYEQNYHGMSVLSCMGGNLPPNLIGTAPDASFYLFRSEDVATEYPIEMDNWVAAAELADSLGVDVINSSLGYSEFDDPKLSYKYADMNGHTTRVTQGANMAFRKGILVFNSAGNEGNNAWRHIIAPSDGEQVIGVGAVDKSGIRAAFSSIGPAYGGAIKPNVSAMGALTFLITSAGIPGYSSGTSFSSPVLAGMGACLLQSVPGANVNLIKAAIEKSASIYSKPDSLLGYGIPNFEKAYNLLNINTSAKLITLPSWSVSPNPFNNSMVIRNLLPVSGDRCIVSIFAVNGICLWQSGFSSASELVLEGLSGLPAGLMILSIQQGGKREYFKMIKTNK